MSYENETNEDYWVTRKSAERMITNAWTIAGIIGFLLGSLITFIAFIV